MGANEIKRLLHRALVLLDEMDAEPETVKSTPASYGLDAIVTQPVVLPNPEPSVVAPPIEAQIGSYKDYEWREIPNTQAVGVDSPSVPYKCVTLVPLEPTSTQKTAQAALGTVKPQTLANAANEAFVDMAALAATLPPEHPLSALVPAAEPPKQRKRKAAGAVDTPTQAVTSPEEVRAALPMIQTPQQNLAPAAPTALPAQAVEPPKVEKLLSPEQEKEIKERLAKYRNEILPAGGMVPVDKIGGVEIQLRKYVAQFCSTKPSSKTWAYEDWKNFVGFFDNMVATVGADGLVRHIQQKIGITK